MANSIYIKRLQADKWLILFMASLISAIGLWYVFTRFEPQYVSEAKVWIRSESRAPYIISIEKPDADKPATMAANPILTQLELMKSSYVAQAHYQFLKKADPGTAQVIKRPEDYLERHFRSNNVISTDTVGLTYAGSNPKVAQTGLNNILQNYMAYRYEIEFGGKNKQAADLGKRLEDTERRLVQIRQRIRMYETSAGATDLSSESTGLVANRLTADTQIAQLDSQIASARASVGEIKSKLPYKNLQTAIQAVALGAQGNPLIELRQKLADAKEQYEFDAVKLAPTNPKLVAQKRKIDQMQAEMNQELQRTLGTKMKSSDLAIYDAPRTKLVTDLLDANVKLQSLAAQRSALQRLRNDMRSQELSLPTKRYNLKNLQQEEANLALAYDELKKKQMESHLRLSDNLDNPLVVIDPPSLPEKEQFPTREQLAALTVLLGLAAGVALSFVKTRLSGFCSDPKLISEITQRPVLVTIPWFANGYQQPGKTLAMEHATDEAIAKLLLEVREHGYQVLTLTSDCQGAHRPTLLMQLGRKFADSGYRVALIDTNFRAPSLACRVEIHQEQSLSNLIERFNSPLTDESAAALLSEYAYQDNDMGIACFLNEQPLASPGRYLCSPGFERLLYHMRKHYDLIIVNTPSILFAPEATAVASLSDATIAATSFAVKESMVIQLTQQLESVQKPFLGTIIRAQK